MLLSLSLIAGLSACGAGGGDTSTLFEISAAPEFSGIVFSTPTNTDEITIAWLAAKDDETSSSKISYRVYLSQEADFIPSKDTLISSISGETQTVLKGLTPGVTYYITVTAVDEDGNESIERKYISETTLLNPVILSSTTPLAKAEELGLETPAISGSEYRYPNNGIQSLPKTGDILVGEDASGGYLVKVVGSSIDGNEVVVQTLDGSLSDAVVSGKIGSTIKLFDISSSEKQNPLGLSKEMRYSDNAGSIEWTNGLLKFEQVEGYVDENWISITREPEQGHYIIKIPQKKSSDALSVYKGVLTGDMSEELTYDVGISFTPELKTDFEWESDLSGISIKSGVVVASGTLSLDAEAIYNFNAEGQFSKDFAFDVFTKNYKAFYMVGNVPVWQDITFTLKAQLSAKAMAAIEAKAATNIVNTVEFGVRYNIATGQWESISSTKTHSESLTADLSVEGGVESKIRLIPNIEVKFYQIVAADLSLEPVVSGNIQVEVVANADLLAGYFPPGITQLTAFDAALNAQCFVGANLQILSNKFPLLNKTQVCEFPLYTFFSLPTLKLNASNQGNEEYLLTADVEDGANNPFDSNTIKWVVYPNDAGTLQIDQSNPRQATFKLNNTVSEATIFFSGYGKLGEIGRQFTQTKIEGLTPPTGLTAIPGNEQVTLTWNTVQGATGYRIYWSANPGVSKTNYVVTASASTTPYTITGLANGTTYYFVITATNGSAESSESIEASAMPHGLIYTGDYFGAYSGDDVGLWSLTIDANGLITGDGQSSIDGTLFTITGSVTTSGNVTFSAAVGGASTGASFSGTITTDGGVSGSWSNSYFGEAGTFGGRKGLVGIWIITEEVTNCDGPGTIITTYGIMVNQTDKPGQYHVLGGAAETIYLLGRNLTWSVIFPEEGGTTTESFTGTLIGNGDTLTGSSVWQWVGSNGTVCNGRSNYSGVRENPL